MQCEGQEDSLVDCSSFTDEELAEEYGPGAPPDFNGTVVACGTTSAGAQPHVPSCHQQVQRAMHSVSLAFSLPSFTESHPVEKRAYIRDTWTDFHDNRPEARVTGIHA